MFRLKLHSVGSGLFHVMMEATRLLVLKIESLILMEVNVWAVICAYLCVLNTQFHIVREGLIEGMVDC